MILRKCIIGGCLFMIGDSYLFRKQTSDYSKTTYSTLMKPIRKVKDMFYISKIHSQIKNHKIILKNNNDFLKDYPINYNKTQNMTNLVKFAYSEWIGDTIDNIILEVPFNHNKLITKLNDFENYNYMESTECQEYVKNLLVRSVMGDICDLYSNYDIVLWSLNQLCQHNPNMLLDMPDGFWDKIDKRIFNLNFIGKSIKMFWDNQRIYENILSNEEYVSRNIKYYPQYIYNLIINSDSQDNNLLKSNVIKAICKTNVGKKYLNDKFDDFNIESKFVISDILIDNEYEFNQLINIKDFIDDRFSLQLYRQFLIKDSESKSDTEIIMEYFVKDMLTIEIYKSFVKSNNYCDEDYD